MIVAQTQGDTGNSAGAFATWKHNQLSLTMTGSNSTTLTEDGQFASHANHFQPGSNCAFSQQAQHPETDYSSFIVAGWGTNTGVQQGGAYISISLPKGYRFTSYKFVMTHDVTRFSNNTSINNYHAQNGNVNIVEKNSDFTQNLSSVVNFNGLSTTEKTLERTSNDMGNTLYFNTYSTSSGYQSIVFRYIELTFTADADTEIELAPGEQMTIGHTLVEIPFKTGKVDFGQISNLEDDVSHNYRYSYVYNNVEDMSANMLLYQEESVRAAQNGEVLDGTSGNVAYNQVGSITTAGDYYKLTTPSKEQVYYLETPVFATMNDAAKTKNPIHYRITGAEIEYNNGSSIYDLFTIRIRNNNTNYYLGSDGSAGNQQTSWFIDNEGYIRTGTNGTTYLSQDNNRYTTVTTNKTNAIKLTIDDNGYVYYRQDNNNYYLIRATYYGSVRFRFVQGQGTTNAATLTKTGNKAQTPNEADENFVLKVYDKTGETPTTYDNASGTVTLSGFNNDAIKFSAKGTGYVKLKLTVQALSPYIDQMSVVVNDVDDGKDLHFKQFFTSDDFSVGGDEFHFYLPTDCQGDDITVTFEDLYSRYGDETYDHIANNTPGNSRYNYVKSNHFNAFTNDNIYSEAGKTEAASSTTETARIAATNGMIRTQVGTVGNKAFKFNNAAELSTSEGRFTEYPFTVAKYGDSNFITAEFTDLTTTQNKTFYVFTTDETRYNIAPTTATQHRFYAFYEMKVHVHLGNYDPEVQFIPVYDKTFYVKDGNEVGGTTQDPQPMYGAIITAVDGDGKAGLASPNAMKTAIETAITAGGDNVPTSIDQLLYVDMHELAGTYETSDLSFANFKNLLATNALIYLPENTTSTLDNFATKTPAGYRAAQDIVVTDKAPFFAPYDISIDAANAARYNRGITWPDNGAVAKATVVLPFTININEDGLHTNPDNTTLNLYHMQKNKSISLGGGDTGYEFDYGIGYFTNIDEDFFDQVGNVRVAKANTPYMVFVNSGTTDEKSFDIVSPGALVKATTDNGVFTGETASGTADGESYSFTSKASYTGEIMENARESANVFYFAGGYFLNSATLKKGLSLYVYPFRTYYAYTGSAPAKLQRFSAVFGENEEDNLGTTGISEVQRNADLAVVSGKGCITLMAKADNDITIYAVNGQTIEKCTLRAGDSRTVNVAAGVYVINGVKIVVK